MTMQQAPQRTTPTGVGHVAAHQLTTPYLQILSRDDESLALFISEVYCRTKYNNKCWTRMVDVYSRCRTSFESFASSVLPVLVMLIEVGDQEGPRGRLGFLQRPGTPCLSSAFPFCHVSLGSMEL